MSAKFEYLYVDFGNTSFSNGGLGDEIAFKEHILRTGMNFKLH